MTTMESWSIIDTWIVLNAVVIAISSTCIGTHIVLKRESLISDAISHSVLPGIALAYIITQSRFGIMLFAGSMLAGLLAYLLIAFIIRVAEIDPSTSMGVVFSGFFALGILLISQISSTVDLDPSCVLFGSLEIIPLETAKLGSMDIPITFISNGSVMILNIIFLILAWRILNTSTLDPYFATSIAMPVIVVRIIQIMLLTLTAVSAFESVGSILIIAFLVVPPVIGWLLSSSLKMMLIISLATGILASALGHVVAIYIPAFFALPEFSSSGSIVSLLALLLLFVLLFSPRAGLVLKYHTKIKNQILVAFQDILKYLYNNKNRSFRRHDFLNIINQSHIAGKVTPYGIRKAVDMLIQQELLIKKDHEGYVISEKGLDNAAQIVEKHHSWERYLYNEGMHPKNIHVSAEQLEHSSATEIHTREVPSTSRIPGHSHS